jgi:branched-chain amino acid transport system ATP-binding protein
MTPILRVRGLRAGYGPVDVLHDVDLDVAEGGITAVLGANGAGKTTLLRAVCGLVRRSGSIRLADEPIERRATEDVARLGVAHVPEGRGTFLQLSVAENLRVGALGRRDRVGVAEDIARMYGYFPKLAERRAQQAGTLSGGEQQMLAIARALMLRPRLLLLDEPSFGLAPLVVQDIYRRITEVVSAELLSVLLVEQNAELALDLSDTAYLLASGSVVVSGPAAAIRADAAVQRVYLGG